MPNDTSYTFHTISYTNNDGSTGTKMPPPVTESSNFNTKNSVSSEIEEWDNQVKLLLESFTKNKIATNNIPSTIPIDPVDNIMSMNDQDATVPESYRTASTPSSSSPSTSPSLPLHDPNIHTLSTAPVVRVPHDIHTFRSNGCCSLWIPEKYGYNFYTNRKIHFQRQVRNACVSTVLSMLTDAPATEFRAPYGKYAVNTQDPVEWSVALQNFGMKLAYTSIDCRQLRWYKDELLANDDLWTISYYTPYDATDILDDPDEDGRICGSHIVILHRNMVYDSCREGPLPLEEHGLLNKYAKRIFRVVPKDHIRGL